MEHFFLFWLAFKDWEGNPYEDKTDDSERRRPEHDFLDITDCTNKNRFSASFIHVSHVLTSKSFWSMTFRFSSSPGPQMNTSVVRSGKLTARPFSHRFT